MYHVFWQPPTVKATQVPKPIKTQIKNENKQKYSYSGCDNYKYTDAERLKAWEVGQIDYRGVDSFASIQRKLDEAINEIPTHKSQPQVNNKPRVIEEREDNDQLRRAPEVNERRENERHENERRENERRENERRSSENERRSSENERRRRAWEAGQIDYRGVDSFASIQRKLDEAINQITTQVNNKLRVIDEEDNDQLRRAVEANKSRKNERRKNERRDKERRRRVRQPTLALFNERNF